MPRLVLLGFDDDDVDVLSRVSGLKSRPEVVVAHPDPDALILKLAEISELETRTDPPEPREGDVVVTPEVRSSSLAEWIASFERMGVRVLAPAALDTDLDWTSGEAPAADPPAPGREVEVDPEPAPDPASSGPGIPAEVFTQPQATFRYLVETALGKDAATTLWWEALPGIWVPLLWAGDAPWNSTSRVDLNSPWGRFGITELGEQRKNHELLLALTRVAEDVAFRDQALWERRAKALGSMEVPRNEAEWNVWAEQILDVLEPETAWLWVADEKAWSSVRTWGDGVSLEGRLTLSPELLENLFHGKQWEHWSPAEEVRMHVTFAEGDHRWKLRLERLKRALGKESA